MTTTSNATNCHERVFYPRATFLSIAGGVALWSSRFVQANFCGAELTQRATPAGNVTHCHSTLMVDGVKQIAHTSSLS